MLAARVDFAGSAVLDLYAGSGALGLEALSRGAASATFVEADHRAAAVIERNAATLGFGAATVMARPVAAVLAARPASAVDLVLADPPYDMAVAEVDAMLAALTGNGWTGAGTIAVVERRGSTPESSWPAQWHRWPTRRYGDTRLEFGALTRGDRV